VIEKECFSTTNLEDDTCSRSHTYKVVPVFTSNVKYCVHLQGVSYKTVYDALVSKFGEPETWDNNVWRMMVTEHANVFIESDTLYKALKGDNLLKM